MSTLNFLLKFLLFFIAAAVILTICVPWITGKANFAFKVDWNDFAFVAGLLAITVSICVIPYLLFVSNGPKKNRHEHVLSQSKDNQSPVNPTQSSRGTNVTNPTMEEVDTPFEKTAEELQIIKAPEGFREAKLLRDAEIVELFESAFSLDSFLKEDELEVITNQRSNLKNAILRLTSPSGLGGVLKLSDDQKHTIYCHILARVFPTASFVNRIQQEYFDEESHKYICDLREKFFPGSQKSYDQFVTPILVQRRANDKMGKRIDLRFQLRTVSKHGTTDTSMEREKLLNWLHQNPPDPGFWHEFALNTLPDLTERVYLWIVSHPLCDAATAAIIFHWQNPFELLPPAKISEHDLIRLEVCKTICRRANEQSFSTNKFELPEYVVELNQRDAYRKYEEKSLAEGPLPFSAPEELFRVRNGEDTNTPWFWSDHNYLHELTQ